MKKYAEINRTDFPIIKVTFTGVKASKENFVLYLDGVKQSYDHQNRIAIIFDANNAVIPGISYQQMQAKWLKDNNKMMKDFCVGTAYVISSTVIRNILKAIFTFQPQPVPYTICKDIGEAETWVKKQLATAE